MRKTWRELVTAARTLRKSPAFALTAIVTMGLGIGASTAVFSVVNAVLLRPLPYTAPDRLVHVWVDLQTRNAVDFPNALGDLGDLRRHGTNFEGLAAIQTGRQALSGDDGEAEQVVTAGATTNLFTLLGTRVIVGRNFVDADGAPQPQPPQAPVPQQAGPPGSRPGAAPPAGPAPAGAAPQQPPAPRLPAIAILSHEFWQRRYGGDSSIVGRSIDLGNNRANVVGVLEPGFELLYPPGITMDRRPDVYVAIRVDLDNASRVNVGPRVIGRLKPGVTLSAVQAQLDGIAADLRSQFPIKQTSGFHFRAEPMNADLVADVKPAILALMGGVVFVLLIACANVANLLLVRSSVRERELAVRAALGGTRWVLIRQMMAESVVLAGTGVVLGLFLANAGIDLLRRIAPPGMPRVDTVRIDPLVLGFTAIAGLLSALVFGVLPALRASRPDVADVLRASGRTGGLRAGRALRHGVVVAEVALSFVLLVGSGLMLRSFASLMRQDPGYDPTRMLTFLVSNPRAREIDQRAAFVRNLRERLKAIPGVTGVTAASPLPLDGTLSTARWGTDEALTDASKFQQGLLRIVQPGYFETMRTRLIEGRVFTEADNDTGSKAIVIDKRLAGMAFPNQPAVGKRLLIRLGAEPEYRDIIGVVAHQRDQSLAIDGEEAFYIPDGAFGFGAANRWAVRTSGDPAQIAPLVRATVTELSPLVAIGQVQAMDALVDRVVAPTRFSLVLISIFAVIAAVLATVGLYGVLSTVVRQRTAEIGVRMAFGASRSTILQLIVGQGLRLSVAGVAIGALAALGLTRTMKSMLVGVRPTDPVTFGAMIVAFVVVASVASWLPARRASRLDPVVALREE